MTTKPISWSFSKKSDFDKCRLLYKIKHIDKVPEPERPLKPGQLEHANDRGTRVHENIEGFIRGDHDALCVEAEKHFGLHMYFMRQLYAEGMVEMEGEWAFDREWEVADWNAGWIRMKLDALIRVSPTQAIVLDWKTGRHFGNEVAHAEQLSLYAVATFLRYPELEELSVADVYIDHGTVTERKFTRSQALRFKQNFTNQGRTITEATEFPPNPNRFSCQWCPYGPEHTGHCQVGVRKASP